MLKKFILIFLLISYSKEYIIKSPENQVNYNALCIDKGANEYFRLSPESECREVVQCSESGLIYLRCPHGLSFDIEKQTCDWKSNVLNCNQVQATRIPYLINYNITYCDIGKLSCKNGECIEKTLFCNGKSDCSDNSDEKYCQEEDNSPKAPTCNKETCKLPECYCSNDGTEIPNNLEVNKVPQMIMITFDDAVNNNNIDIYNELFRYGRNNANGCSIKGTFFMSHKYSNYSAVENLSYRGHEIAVHSITHRSKEDYWSRGSSETWAKEMAGARLIYERFGNIEKDSIVGIRAPLLKVGGNNQFEMMEDNSFLYDSSLSAPLSNTPIWPYTLHHRMPHLCYGNGQNCPTKSYPIWEIVMNEYDRRENPETDQRLSGCVMVDQCSNIVDGQLLFRFLENNFERHYNSNRAPLGLYFHASFFLNPELLEAFTTWIDEKLKDPNVYFVSMEQVIRWMQNPTELKDIQNFEPWRKKCNVQSDTCYVPNQCPLTTREIPGETIRLHTCQSCPKSYPFIENPLGLPME